MTSITATAKEFFDACETGKGWEGCKTLYRLQFLGHRVEPYAALATG